MHKTRKRRPRNPVATRQIILDAAVTLFAKDGPDAVSLSEVAVLAGVNRGTAYQHFETREKLIEATNQRVSDTIFRAVFGDPETVGERDVAQVDMNDVTERLAFFAMDNPALCRAWFLQILAMPDPSSDPFWREYAGSIGRFAHTDMAQPDIDVEVFSIITLAGYFLWPAWAEAHSRDITERAAFAKRFAREILRLSMFGTMRAEKFPDIVEKLSGPQPNRPKLRIAN